MGRGRRPRSEPRPHSGSDARRGARLEGPRARCRVRPDRSLPQRARTGASARAIAARHARRDHAGGSSSVRRRGTGVRLARSTVELPARARAARAGARRRGPRRAPRSRSSVPPARSGVLPARYRRDARVRARDLALAEGASRSRRVRDHEHRDPAPAPCSDGDARRRARRALDRHRDGARAPPRCSSASRRRLARLDGPRCDDAERGPRLGPHVPERLLPRRRECLRSLARARPRDATGPPPDPRAHR